jgi:hypothetical protein
MSYPLDYTAKPQEFINIDSAQEHCIRLHADQLFHKLDRQICVIV